MALEIDWLSGNCPVQGEGTFDGEAFYFRARGTHVTVDVGDWEWSGPTYEWPEAGWISEDLARAYIQYAYQEWLTRDTRTRERSRYRQMNDNRHAAMKYILVAAELEQAIGDEAKAAIEWLQSKAHQKLTETK